LGRIRHMNGVSLTPLVPRLTYARHNLSMHTYDPSHSILYYTGLAMRSWYPNTVRGTGRWKIAVDGCANKVSKTVANLCSCTCTWPFRDRGLNSPKQKDGQKHPREDGDHSRPEVEGRTRAKVSHSRPVQSSTGCEEERLIR